VLVTKWTMDFISSYGLVHSKPRNKSGTEKVAKLVFTALHGMQTRSSDENSVHPSAYRLSIGTDVDDLERRNNPYFAFFPHQIR